MNLRAKCTNEKCKSYGIDKSVIAGQSLGFGASNDRVKCASCGELMKTTKSMSAPPRAKARTKSQRTITSGRN